MGSFIANNKRYLSDHHYIRTAQERNYWFDFTSRKVDSYKRKKDEKFCLIINGSSSYDDAYILPYSELKNIFLDEETDERNRWMGTIRDNIMRLSPSGRSISVSAYYNAFEFLKNKTEIIEFKETDKSQFFIEKIEIENIKDKIADYNRKYKNASPRKQLHLSEEISRPGLVTDYLKRLHDYTCQICNEMGFYQTNSIPYIEAHHVIELHELKPGSYCSDNIVIVCANCHRKLHFAPVKYELDGNNLKVIINGAPYRFELNFISS